MVNVNRATATQYQLIFPLLPSETEISSINELTLNLFAISLPSVSLNTGESLYQGNKMNFHNGGMTFDPWNISYIVDSNFDNWKILFNWLTFINNNKDNPSEKPATYMVDASLKLMDNYNNETLVIMFKNVWIQSLGELQLSIRDGETHIECNATLYYDRYEILS